ncbi:DUF6443 domain-containing protein [Aquimarina sp. AU119]|uniref:DUF6443 domain-containing protein n=1 Tax=Aquimarina sp. AU119 TaxID=2108528 RepID=UPI001359F4F8|nr:DUF6443 domain-containing protein [Aquimarina sp. AU119]
MITLVLMLIFIVLTSNTIAAQVQGNISGPTISNIGETHRYELFLSGFQGNPTYQWQVTGGLVVSQTTNKADISFVDSGTVTITCIVSFSNNDQIYAYDYNVTVFPNVVAPPNPTVILGCNNATLNRTGDPDPNVTWYWQGKNPDGENFNLGNDATYTANEGSGRYYIRAYDYNGGWSDDSGFVDVTIPPLVTPPSIPSITELCGSTTLSFNSVNVPNGVTWYWQSSDSGTDSSNSESSISFTEGNATGNVHYIKAQDNTTGCWSTATRIDYIINSSSIWYADTDGDGFGDPNTSLSDCTQPTGYVNNANDQCPEVYGLDNGCVVAPYTPITISNENYIFTRVYQEAMVSSDDIRFNKDVIESITYFDGLGRPKQQVGIKASPNIKDIVTHIPYDDYGRQTKDYLPFERNSTTAIGSYATVNINNDINSYYKTTYGDDFIDVPANHQDFNAYSGRAFEASPLNRVQKQGAPGKDWKVDSTSNNDHTIKFDWNTNLIDEVIHFKVTFERENTGKPQLVKDGFYTSNQLHITITKDENWQPGQTHPNDHTTKEYKDKLGRVILKQTFNEGIPHDTYYVYDDFGNLTYVIPPKVTTSDGVNSVELNALCYQYKYDYRNRLVEKKIPGKGGFTDWESIIYNKLDQPILTQDANQKVKGEWLFTKYDAFGRVAYTGIYKSTRNRGTLILVMSGIDTFWEKREPATATGGTTLYYSNDAFPNTDIEILTVNYYDDYNFDINGLSNPGTVYGIDTSDRTKSLATGSKVKVLETDNWITTVTYYDQKARPIYVASKNDYLNTTDIVESKLDFIGRVEETKTTHTKDSNPPIVTVDKFSYDHVGRLLTQTQQINTQNVEHLVHNKYDALGQLIKKDVGGTSTMLSTGNTIISPAVQPLQTVNYKYNVRGWLKQINDLTRNLGTDLFAYKINYNTTEIVNSNPLYNGNISETHWRTANDDILRNYHYSYDALNRLKQASFIFGIGYSSSYTYDKNGNIETLVRFDQNSFSDTMDDLTYTYDWGNKLLSVSDTGNTKGFKDGNTSGNDYDYDKNGNMTKDRNKGITNITYNHLNLPETVSISNNEGTGDITYIYDATGVKLKKTAPSGSSLTITEYAGNYIYKNGELEFFNTSEGYVEPVTQSGSTAISSFEYIYQYKDHLGNIRLSYKDTDKDGSITQDEIVEEKNYYPFGLEHKGYNNTIIGREHNYGFVGKEENSELGLEWLDFGARNYDASLGRWMNLDPMAEMFYGWAPYKYSMNNPILLSDPDGNCEFCKKFLNSAFNAYKSTLYNTYEGAKKLVNSPIQTVKAAASNHFTVVGMMQATDTALNVVSGGVHEIAKDVAKVATSDDLVATAGQVYGEKVADLTIEVAAAAAGEAGGKAISKTAKSLKNLGKTKASKSFATKTFDESTELVAGTEFSGTISGEGGAMTVEIEAISKFADGPSANASLINAVESIAVENGMSSIKVVGNVLDETAAGLASGPYIKAGYEVSTKIVNGSTQLTRTKTLK